MYPHSQELLLEAAAGDEVAFGTLYDLMAPRVYGIIRGVLSEAAQADQVMIEALVEVWRAAPGYDANHGSASGWIYATAHHYAVRRARAMRAKKSR